MPYYTEYPSVGPRQLGHTRQLGPDHLGHTRQLEPDHLGQRSVGTSITWDIPVSWDPITWDIDHLGKRSLGKAITWYIDHLGHSVSWEQGSAMGWDETGKVKI